jgi:UDP-N-acetylmuramoyl-tripeptide--D-alanyl-D-alanine ligase
MEYTSIERIYEIFEEYPCICTDSRRIIPDSIFFALKGDSFDGNSFVRTALEQGCAFAVSDDAENAGIAGNILVADVQDTLQRLAAMHRRKLNITLMMITGTNGKTTTKELLKTVLSEKYRVAATQGNLNNHIGVPLTLLGMDKNVQFAVVEAGANHAGEIAALCEIAAPDFGLITNVGKAHLEGFGSLEGVKAAKGELYAYLEKTRGTAFYNTDDSIIKTMIDGYVNLCKSAYGASIYGASAELAANACLRVKIDAPAMTINTNLAGEYNLNNVLAAVATGLYFEIPVERIVEALSDYRPENSRSQIIIAGSNTVIMDAYNANPSSMEAAINNLAKLNGKRMAILGDMLELGNDTVKEHLAIMELVDTQAFDLIFFVGDNFAKAASLHSFRSNIFLFKDRYEVRNHLSKNPPENFYILIKGSNGMKLEELRELLIAN